MSAKAITIAVIGFGLIAGAYTLRGGRSSASRGDSEMTKALQSSSDAKAEANIGSRLGSLLKKVASGTAPLTAQKPELETTPEIERVRSTITELESRMEREEVIHRLNTASLTPERRRELLSVIDALSAARAREITLELQRIETEIDKEKARRAAMVK